MRILKIGIKNFLGIAGAEIEANGKSQLITGGNAKGKTSILSAVKAAFEGADKGSIRVGSDKAEILLELEEISIERTIRESGSELTVLTLPDRVKVGSPQKFLKEISNALTFNPVAFYLQKPTERRETLLRAMPIRATRDEVAEALTSAGVDGQSFLGGPLARRIDYSGHGLDVLGKLYAIAYEQRHGVGQELKTKRAILETVAVSSMDATPYDAEAHNETVKALDHAMDVQQKREQLARSIASREAELAMAREAVKRLEDARERDILQHAQVMAEEIGDAEKLRHEAMKWQDVRAVDESRKQTAAKVEKIQAEAGALSQQRETLDRACEVLEKRLPAAKLEEAGAPVEGLSITPEGVTVAGVPLEHLSSAEQMRLAIRIAESAIPPGGAQILCIDGAERLDSEQFAILSERLTRGDLQGFVTQVTGGERVVAEMAPKSRKKAVEVMA